MEKKQCQVLLDPSRYLNMVDAILREARTGERMKYEIMSYLFRRFSYPRHRYEYFERSNSSEIVFVLCCKQCRRENFHMSELKFVSMLSLVEVCLHIWLCARNNSLMCVACIHV